MEIVDLHACVTAHLEQRIGCKLPWTNSSGRQCQTASDYRAYLEQYRQVIALSEDSISRNTGCLPRCRRREFTRTLLSTSHEVVGANDAGKARTVEFLLFYPTGRYTVKNYYYVYDGNTAFADVGGYLGLLLGHSLLSFYDALKDGYNKMVKVH